MPAAIVVRTLGGTVGNFHSRVEETPVFHPGEETYLFLWGSEGQPLRVLGWSQGTFRIARDTRTSVETAQACVFCTPIPRTRSIRDPSAAESSPQTRSPSPLFRQE